MRVRFALIASTAMFAAHHASAQAKPIDPRNFDTTCAACADFNRFANGGWMKRSSIPAANSSWGTWEELNDHTLDILHRIADDAAGDRTAPAGSSTQKIGTYYGTCMDSSAVDAAGIAPLAPLLGRIAAITSGSDVERAIVQLHADGARAPFAFGSTEDPKQAGTVIAYAGQAGLGLPDRDFYTRRDERSLQLQETYRRHIARLLELAGESAAEAKVDADTVLMVESRLAFASMTRVEQRDPNATYHKMTVAELQALTPHFDWARYLAAIQAPALSQIDVAQPHFFSVFDQLLSDVSVRAWQAYLRTRIFDSLASSLGAPFVDEDFRFKQSFTGAKEMQPRWRRCLIATGGAVPELLGELYVKQTFTPAAKARAQALVANLRAALRDRITALEWMSAPTKHEALAKLDALRTKIGYPDKWVDYSAFDIQPGPFVENRMRLSRWSAARSVGKIGKPVDRTEWIVPPQTVDAYATNNEITFPTAILQAPFFDPNADDAVNYGAMGAVIGHEITHHFDDGGRQFDAAGNLRDWWTPADAVSYTQRAQRVIDQFSGYTVVDSTTHVNGVLTQGENIADLGGLKVAYDAMEKALAAKGRPALIDGSTPEQRFFLSYAQIWRNLSRPEYLRQRVNTDPHAPLMWRVNGPLSNMPEFAKAFRCKAGDAMVRPASVRAQIW